jgi:hypothetical protein
LECRPVNHFRSINTSVAILRKYKRSLVKIAEFVKSIDSHQNLQLRIVSEKPKTSLCSVSSGQGFAKIAPEKWSQRTQFINESSLLCNAHRGFDAVMQGA